VQESQFVAYYRVSTDRQGQSGLRLDAQRAAVLDYLNGNGRKLTAEFTEVESGKRADRPELAKALDACRRHRARLVIAKLDRLSRNLAFIATLMESGVEFVAVDNPHANKLTVHILAAVAQHEREMISQRTKDALRAARVRGVRLGNPRPEESLAKARAIRAEKAALRVANVLPMIRELQAAGITSRAGIAAALSKRGIATPRGRRWWAKHPPSTETSTA
jgi:DNA invertase Pin-like site-specific DNA recombinase